MQAPFQYARRGAEHHGRGETSLADNNPPCGNGSCLALFVLPTHDVQCPECGKFLYTALSLEDFFPADAPTHPRVLADEQGDYLPCPHCRARVPMTRVVTSAGTGFRIAKSS